MKPRPIALTLLLILATIAAGLAIRFASLGLPQIIVKYGGSALWALMVYWIVSAVFSSQKIPTAALLAGLVAAVVECIKLYHSPSLDAFRHTLPGILLLGRFFSLWDIAVYWLAIACGAFVDIRLRRARR